jgi:glycosyltransferase involved in cell wall biosynthesis
MKKTVYYWSPCLTNVGTVKSTLNSAIALAKYNHNFNVVMLNVFGEWTEHSKYLINRGVKIKDLTFNFSKILPKYGFFQSRFSYIIIFLISFIPLLILLKKNKPAYIIAHLITSLPLILFNFFSFKTRLILRISGYPKLNYIRRKFWNFSSNVISNITCPTSELIQDLKKQNMFLNEKITLLNDAILNIEDFKKKINDKSFSPTHIIPDNFFLSVGRFTKQKNYEFLVKEFKEFCSKYPSEKLLIIGDGELKEKIIKLIEKYNLSQNIFILEHTPNVYYFMKKAKAFILSSLWEEVGFVIVEAAISNSIVISSNCKNGPKEFLSDGNAGFLFENNKNRSLEKNLNLFMNSEKKNLYKKRVKAKKNSIKFTMFRHQIELKKLLF